MVKPGIFENVGDLCNKYRCMNIGCTFDTVHGPHLATHLTVCTLLKAMSKSKISQLQLNHVHGKRPCEDEEQSEHVQKKKTCRAEKVKQYTVMFKLSVVNAVENKIHSEVHHPHLEVSILYDINKSLISKWYKCK